MNAQPRNLRRALAALNARLGHRGRYLLCVAGAWEIYGLGIILDPRFGTVRGVGILQNLAPLHWWGLFWMLCAAIAGVYAFASKPGRDWIGFIAAALPALVWAGAYLVSWISQDYPRAWTSAGAWLFAALRLGVAAGWPEHTRQEQRK
ncbi:hypothetical protein [Streptomyces xanthochromogenes]